MPFSVRTSKPEDAEAACSVVRASIEVCCAADHGGERARLDAWLKNKTPETFSAWIQSDSLYCVVVEESSKIVGFGMAAAGEVLLCYVAPEVRFRGAGKAVLQAIELWAATSGVPELRLESTCTALAFYRCNGFKSCGPVFRFAGMEGHPMSKPIMSNPSIEGMTCGKPQVIPHVKR
jgi:GNAT superfamily N-acetyltransferase